MSDVFTIVAAAEWIVVGAIAFYQLRKLNRRMNDALDDFKKEMSKYD